MHAICMMRYDAIEYNTTHENLKKREEEERRKEINGGNKWWEFHICYTVCELICTVPWLIFFIFSVNNNKISCSKAEWICSLMFQTRAEVTVK